MYNSIFKLFFLVLVLYSLFGFSQKEITVESLQKNYSYEELKKIFYHRRDTIIPKNDSLKPLIIRDKYSEIAELITFDVIKKAISIYEYDNRSDLEDVIYTEVKKNANGVGILVNYKDFNNDLAGLKTFTKENDSLLDTTPYIFKINNRFILNSKPLYKRFYNLCNSIRFVKQPSITNSCTAFAISKKYILTAAHCVKGKNLNNMRIAFDYIKNGDNYGNSIKKENIYRIEKVYVGKEREDYAILKIKDFWKRLPSKRDLKIDLKYKYEKDESLYILGHPLGLPMKFSDDAKIEYKSNKYITARIDAHSGNSGSPIFNKQNKVIGILSGGSARLFSINQRRNCKTWGICKQNECSGEKIFKITELKSILNNLNITQ